ncbi:unnamed protein product [Kuraishia capsulata CBS 1993]|uniref:Protein kinase domain-containing protein n=1 Tax=Kuraishia capsulata CBS 1993 TaxID=1382522 RepID=W6MRM7_9ASCO|nr:uncharacterized protein KUCA_T00000448001 [Kuraishia capsulata CBS 1993]CDK24485.1 unnamed protein product [Kuraishia capsulata CBS 1993]
MTEIFSFDDEELATHVQTGLTLEEKEELEDSPNLLSTLNFSTNPKKRSDSVISVGSINNRLGTSYEVGIQQPYFAVSSKESEPIPAAKKLKPKVSDFEPLKVLGRGAYGKVILVRETRSGKLYAQKQLKKASMVVEAKNYERTVNERTILERVNHPNIVKLFYAFQDFDKVYLILEYLEGGELFTHLAEQNILSERIASFYVAEIILALRHLHLNVGVVYRDLKPENCMLNRKGYLVLTDFGLSKVSTRDGKSNTLTGTPQYMAPEILQEQPYDYAVDWWSLGAVCYDLLTGSPPFTGSGKKQVLNKIVATKTLKTPHYVSQDARDILVKLLRKSPLKRLNCDENFETIKNHRFFRHLDWEALIRQDDIAQPPPIIPVVTNPELAENFDADFTSMPISPPGSPYDAPVFSRREESSFIPITKTTDKTSVESVYFKNFSYTTEGYLE